MITDILNRHNVQVVAGGGGVKGVIFKKKEEITYQAIFSCNKTQMKNENQTSLSSGSTPAKYTKNHFFKKFLRFEKIGLKIPKKYFRNKNMFNKLFWPMQHCARSVHALLSRKPACTERAWGLHGPKYSFKHVFISKIFFWII